MCGIAACRGLLLYSNLPYLAGYPPDHLSELHVHVHACSYGIGTINKIILALSKTGCLGSIKSLSLIPYLIIVGNFSADGSSEVKNQGRIPVQNLKICRQICHQQSGRD